MKNQTIVIGALFLLMLNVQTSFSHDEPILVINDQRIDDNFVLADFYLYQGTLFDYAYIRLTNTSWNCFQWIELKWDAYKGDEIVLSEFAFPSNYTYGVNGILPNSSIFLSAFMGKGEYDKIVFYVESELRDGTDAHFNENALEAFDIKLEAIPGARTRISGSVINRANQNIKSPMSVIAAFKDERAIYNELAFVITNTESMAPGQVGTFSFNLNLPPEYDEIRVIPHYSVWSTGNVTVKVDERSDPVAGYMLEQNYPNPFNAATTVRFTVPAISPVTITVYDILGRKVDELFTGVATPGMHSLIWNAAHLPTGQYLLRLQTSGLERSIRCSYIK